MSEACDGAGVPKNGPRFRPMPFAEMSPFEQRIRLLCEATGLGVAELGTTADLSRETVPRWLDQARKGVLIPGKADGHRRLALRYGVPIAWLIAQDRLAAGSKPPIGPAGIGEPTASGVSGQISALYEAVDLLQRLDGVPRERGWSLMLDLAPSPPTPLAFYELARRKLPAKKG